MHRNGRKRTPRRNRLPLQTGRRDVEDVLHQRETEPNGGAAEHQRTRRATEIMRPQKENHRREFDRLFRKSSDAESRDERGVGGRARLHMKWRFRNNDHVAHDDAERGRHAKQSRRKIVPA